jgi:uncharacterized protein YbaP (TraB family)
VTARLRAAFFALLLAAVPAVANAAPALWQVSDGDSKVWLFGSIHVLTPDVQWRTPLFDQTLKQADQVYFEADIGPLGQLGLVIQSIKMGLSKPEPWLARLDAGHVDAMSADLEKIGLTLPQLQNYPLWLADAMVEETAIEKHGYQPALGVDSILQGELPKERKAYFETAVQQMEMLAADPQDRQVARFVQTVDGLDKLPEQLDAMTKVWADGKGDELAAQIADDPSMDAAFAQTMVHDRNAKWVTSIEGLLADNHQDLIVVGAAHLSGDGSVIDLLGKAGFTVQRIQ